MPGDVPSSKNKENKKTEPTIDVTQLTRPVGSDQSSSGSTSDPNKLQELLALQREAQEKLKKQREEFKEIKEERAKFEELPLEDQLFLAPTIQSLLPKVKESKTPPSSTPE